MKHIKRNLGLTLSSVLAVSLLAVGPVAAEQGISGGGGTSSGGGTSTTSPTSSPTATPAPTPKPVKVETEVHASTSTTSGSTKPVGTDDSTVSVTENEHVTAPDPATGKVSELRGRGEKLLAEDRLAKKSDTTVADHQKACQARAASLDTRINNFGTQATAHLTSLDATFVKVQAYQSANKLTVPTYDALVVTATTKQATATAAVAALKAVSVKIDCTSTDPASSVATVKAAVKNARVALQDYRTSIKSILVTLMTAKNAAATTSTTTTTSTKETN